MTQEEQTRQFAHEIHCLISRARAEYSLTLASVIGTLEIQKHTLIEEQIEEEEE